MNVTIPGHVFDLNDFALWAKTQSRPLSHWGDEIATLSNTAADHDELCSDLESALEKTCVDDLPAIDTYQDGLAAIMDRFTFIRDALLERHDVDPSAERYQADVKRVVEAAALFDQVRVTLLKLGAIQLEDDDAYCLACLRALLG